MVTRASGKCPTRWSNSSINCLPHSRLNESPCSIRTSPSYPIKASLKPAARSWLMLNSGRAPISAICLGSGSSRLRVRCRLASRSSLITEQKYSGSMTRSMAMIGMPLACSRR
ncbi:hypothetical protein D3C76_1341580 [compost metagenome]